MKKSLKILLGVAAFWPVFFLLCMLLGFTSLPYSAEPNALDPSLFLVIKIVAGVTAVLVLGQVAGYAIYITRSPRISQRGKFQYLALLVIGHFFTLPLIWRTIIWNGRFFTD